MSARTFSRMARGLLVTACMLPLAAEEPGFTKDLKLRWAYAPSIQDNLRHASQGFGINLGFPTSIGRLGVELGYYYKTGDSYFMAPQSSAVPGGPLPADPDLSGDARRNQLDGFNVRVSLVRPLSEDMSWQVGVQLGGTRFKHEYVGDMRSYDWDKDHPQSWRDTYSGTPVEGGLLPSPYGGVTFKISSRSSLECNVMLLNYKALEYNHKPGSGSYAIPHGTEAGPIADHNAFKADSLTKTSRLAAHLEIAYVFHF